MKQEQENAEPGDATAPGSSGSDEKHADPKPSAHDFHPIRIKGEPLSVTVLRERRERPW
jgi:hypothetical protein